MCVHLLYFCVICVFFVPSVLWYGWLCLLTCKAVSQITYTVLVETLNPVQSVNQSMLVYVLVVVLFTSISPVIGWEGVVFYISLVIGWEGLVCSDMGIMCRLSGGTAVAVPPPFRPSEPALCGSCPLVTPYYCRLGDLLCLFV